MGGVELAALTHRVEQLGRLFSRRILSCLYLLLYIEIIV